MKLILAPMATLTHEALRRAVFRFGGCDEYYTEMIHAASLIHGGQFEKYYLLNGPCPERIVWQLTGTDVESITEATRMVRDLGGIGVDLNMGCSAPEIYRFGAGIAWMMKPLEETRRLVHSVRQALPDSLRLSVKMRLGDEDFTKEKLYQFTDMLMDEGVTQLTLHPRTRKEKYTRPARWQYLEPFTQHVKERNPAVQVIGNGCVSDPASLDALLRRAPSLDGVMCARFAVQKPWLFAELQRHLENGTRNHLPVPYELPSSIDLYGLADSFLTDLETYQPKEFYDSRSRRFFAYFLDNFMYHQFLKNQILNAHTHETQMAPLAEYFKKMPEERFVPYNDSNAL